MDRRATIYARISEALDGSLLGVERQFPPCKQLCTTRGWTIIPDPLTGEQVFVDNDLSASRFSDKRRPAYERMLDLHRDGIANAIVVLESDRLTRRPTENETVIEMAERYGISLVTVAGEIDLATATGRLMFRMQGSVAAHESELKSERVRRKFAQKALAGEDAGGIRAFGRADDRVSLHPTEAPLVQQAVARLLDGWTLAAVVRDWTSQGITTTRGNPWLETSLRRMLLQPRLYGAREHNGQVVKEDAFPPIVDRQTWEELRALLTDPSRRHVEGARKYLLSGIATCWACEAALVGDPQRGKPFYTCHPRHRRKGCGKTTVSAVALDGVIGEAIIERLSGPGLERARAAYANADPEYRQLAVQRQDEDQALADLAHARFVERSIRHSDYLKIRSEIEARLESIERALGRKTRGSVLARLPKGEKALRAWWESPETQLEERREVILAAVHRIIVGPGRPARFDPARVLPPYGPQWIDA